MQIEWIEEDPEAGTKRSVRAERFARKWSFRVRARRRTNWEPPAQVTREMWETLLDALERRLPRREGVTDEDVKQVRAVIAGFKPPPSVEENVSPQRHEDHTKGHKENGKHTRGTGYDGGSDGGP